MNCPYCGDSKEGEFSGIDVRCQACGNRFYAARNGNGYPSAPWHPWMLALVLPLAGGGVVWTITRYAYAGDLTQVAKTLVVIAIVLVTAECIRRYTPVPEV